MSMYSDYLAELGHKEILEKEEIGFATYLIQGPECYIDDIYIKPELRQSKVASQLADEIAEIAKKRGCSFLSGSVNTQIKDPTRSMRVLLGYGFQFAGCNEKIMFFKKDLQ